jgi:hypothetical protein
MAKQSGVELSRTYTSFSGVDIKVVVDGQPIGTLQAISYAVQREKAPIFVMGRVDPLSFSRGKRGIAGTMISLLLDEHMLYSAPWNMSKFIADNDEIYPNPDALSNVTTGANGGLQDLETISTPTFDASDVSTSYTFTGAWYVDQLPPFDVAIVAANEYGKAATMRIYGIEILNEGSGFSIDDVQIENQMTYVARTILPWQKLGEWDMNTGAWTTTSST